MKPTVITATNPGATTAGGEANSSSTNGVNVPINHEYGGTQAPSQQYPHQPYSGPYGEAGTATYSSPSGHGRHYPTQFQGFGFDPDMDMDMDMDMFPRARLGRMHDPFAGFGGSPDFGFPQFGSMGRRRAPPTETMSDDRDFFNRLPSEFRQYMPDGFGHRRAAGSGPMPQPQTTHGGQPQYYQGYVPGSTPPNGAPQSPSKKLCDAAIQTEEMPGHCEVDSVAAPSQNDNLNQRGLRNTVDMGIMSAVENENHGSRSHSAPPPEQLKQQQQHQQHQQQQQQHHHHPLQQHRPAANGKRPMTPPQSGQQQFGTQTSPQVGGSGQPQFQKAYYAPQHQPHPQQKQQTPPPPQTPGGTYVRTIPIFVEGRSEPIINSHKEIPIQSGATSANTATAGSSARSFGSQPQQQQQHQQQTHKPQQHHQSQQPNHHHAHPNRPTPLNTRTPPHQPHKQQQQQQSPEASATGAPPQTPHTLDSINKIQDIQRDVLDLMGKVEKFTGMRKDKEYVYLDEMLTRNLLKLDTIDTNGKDSIRLARKEAIKCIQASINVLEAKAEENARLAAQSGIAATEQAPICVAAATNENQATPENVEQAEEATKENSVDHVADTAAPANNNTDNDVNRSEAIPLPPPESMHVEVGEPVADSKQQQLEDKSQSDASVPPPPTTGDQTEPADVESATTTQMAAEAKSTTETK